jgi:hypothetical protein
LKQPNPFGIHQAGFKEQKGGDLERLLLAIFQNAPDVPFSVKDSHHLYRDGFRPVDDGVVG